MNMELTVPLASERIDFHGDTILATSVQADGQPIVAIKELVEKIGLDWSAQLRRIKRDELLAGSMVIMAMETPAGPRDTVGLPLNLLAGFIFGIEASRISDPEKRQVVLTYQRECHDVLFRHFFGPREQADPTADWDWQVIREKLQMVREVRLTIGRQAAAMLYETLGLPLPDKVERKPPASMQGIDFVQQFLNERCVEDATAQVQAARMYEAYCGWAKADGAPSITQTAFGNILTALGINKRKGAVVTYIGWRIRHPEEVAG